MIEYRRGDILKSGAHALVNPVNCVGVSGKGLAKAFKLWEPSEVAVYEKLAKAGHVRIGETIVRYTNRIALCGFCTMILFVPTKQHWRDSSTIGYVRAGLDAIVDTVLLEDVHCVAIPALGCGLGSLSWADVKPLIHAAAVKMSDAGVDVYIYEPMEER